jgi:hypothetical protein
MEPNLARIPVDGDADAKAVLDLARDGVTAGLLGCMTSSDAKALGRYGARNVTVALRRGSAALLGEAFLATAIAQAVHASDDRDVMVGLATDYFAAEQLGLVPAGLFDSDGSWSRHQTAWTSCPPRRHGHGRTGNKPCPGPELPGRHRRQPRRPS